jgi:hypothetical protein
VAVGKTARVLPASPLHDTTILCNQRRVLAVGFVFR